MDEIKLFTDLGILLDRQRILMEKLDYLIKIMEPIAAMANSSGKQPNPQAMMARQFASMKAMLAKHPAGQSPGAMEFFDQLTAAVAGGGGDEH